MYKLRLPIVLPAHERVSVVVLREGYKYDKKLKGAAGKEEPSRYRIDLAAYFAQDKSNDNGFEIFDKRNRYQIYFPKGWE